MKHRDSDAFLDGSGLRVAVVVADFNSEITGGLLNGARARLNLAKCESEIFRAPGAFELPVLSRAAAERGYDAVVALGAVIEGETDHYLHIATQAARGLMDVSIATGVPVAFGVLTVTDPQHAVARSAPGPGNKGAEAAEAAIRAALALRSMG